ncbi:helix-turn-helix domain-containing protein [Nocardia farcinica]|uniref:helix-turn-helix domain-containing protein n=1 Tax=Nocardia farcinica TaxID=37329 RepID=UPI00189434BA|nr:helix-turn-helix domain-containing protein [Nocardia farcinica]MBF6138693.1 helix-turn-helix domain-containing protein [Nocardia farcinica]MBF6387228.1 helix-turn-helix domain-containing protein [Nocardia farcinica]MBF6539500.1 helix-turn-helix domain-containing protein [Nocardia farcinica]
MPSPTYEFGTLLTETQVEELVHIPAGTLRCDRAKGRGLPYVKIGRRVRYRAEDIAAYLEANTVRPGT